MEGGIALKPFIGIGITVDLVPIVGKFGWVGKAVEASHQSIRIYDSGIRYLF